MKEIFKKEFIQQNLRKKSLDPYENREVSQRNPEKELFPPDVYDREKELQRMAKRDITSTRKTWR